MRSAAARRSRDEAWDEVSQEGSAIIEFIFVAVLVLVPLIYLIVTVSVVQQGRLAVTNAARDVGRAIEEAHSSAEADSRAAAALSVALDAHHLSPAEVSLRYVAAGTSCQGAQVAPALRAGNEFAVCVIRQQQLPAVPQFFAGGSVTLVGRFVVHIDDFAVITG